MIVHNEAKALECNLPLFLEQQCKEIQYEVIVVDDDSTDETPDILKRMCTQYPHLYKTFLPKSPINPLRRRLAWSVGIKAAKGDWLVMTDINRPPCSTSFLSELAFFVDNSDSRVIMNYNSHSTRTNTRYQLFSDFSDAAPLLCKAERHSGRGHKGNWLRNFRGLYTAVAVPTQLAHTLLNHFDCNVRGTQLMMLRIRVLLKSITHFPSKPA